MPRIKTPSPSKTPDLVIFARGSEYLSRCKSAPVDASGLMSDAASADVAGEVEWVSVSLGLLFME